MKQSVRINYVKQELRDFLPMYQLIDDTVAGEIAVKKASIKYLPNPAQDDNETTQARYSRYIDRAVFYPVTSRTMKGLLGQIFIRPPQTNFDDVIKELAKNIDGVGVSLDQQSKRAVSFVLKHGRAGLLVDFPTTGGVVTQEDKQSGVARAIIKVYKSADIINCRTITIGSKTLYSLIVLREIEDCSEDDYVEKKRVVYRKLFLDVDGVYKVEVFDSAGNSKGTIATPKDAKGKTFNYIPFHFIGAENNDSTIDDAPLYSIAALNIAHYKNSADYEESVFIAGQPTLSVTGLNQNWINNVLGNEIKVGVLGHIMLPEGAKAEWLQVSVNTIAFEAMKHKEDQMVAIGASLIEETKVEKTATEINHNRISEISVLGMVANNVSAAYVSALTDLCLFEDIDSSGLQFQLNTDFTVSKMDTLQRETLMREWQAGAITTPEYRNALRRDGRVLDDDSLLVNRQKEILEQTQETENATIPTEQRQLQQP